LTGVAEPQEGRVDESTALLLQALHEHLPTAAVRLRQIERQEDGWMLTLAETGTRVRVGARRLGEQIEKLRVYEQSLAQGEMPEAIDLRWRDQIILERQPGGGQRVQG